MATPRRKRKETVLKPVRPNEGIEIAYRDKLYRLVDDMHASLMYWIRAAWRANTPVMAQDATPVGELRNAIQALRRRWLRKFNQGAEELARYFATEVTGRSDKALRRILRDAGFSVEFRLTAAARDVLHAVTGENVALIKSIAETHLSEVEGLVMRSASAGRDLKTLTDELHERYGVTRRRAAFIARDQNNKATAAITRARQDELGITEAIWMHSHGGKKPRPSHVKADGKRYKIKEGMYLDGVWTWPGHEINCRCVSRPVIPALDDGRYGPKS